MSKPLPGAGGAAPVLARPVLPAVARPVAPVWPVVATTELPPMPAEELEVAVLDRGSERRCFRRLPDAEVSSLLG